MFLFCLGIEEVLRSPWTRRVSRVMVFVHIEKVDRQVNFFMIYSIFIFKTQFENDQKLNATVSKLWITVDQSF